MSIVIFCRACEKTIEVLRQNAQTIITTLEVLLYDPLYSWTISPAEAYNRQQDEPDSKSSSIDLSEEGIIGNYSYGRFRMFMFNINSL